MTTNEADQTEERRHVIPPEWEGMRLDKALCDLCPDTSRTKIQEWIKGGGVQVDDEVLLRPSTPLVQGQRLVWRPVAKQRRVASGVVRFAVIHDEPSFAIIDKPAGLVAHPNDGVSGGTVADLAVEQWGELPAVQGPDRPGIVHRLDGATSGLMVIVKTEAAGESVRRQFREREVSKSYLAIVHGQPRFESEWIDQPLGRSERASDRISVVPSEEGREAQTFYEVRERFDGYSLLECKPRTGRTHQIRVHLEWLGHSIVADKIYTGGRTHKALPADAPVPRRQCLHASRLSFSHPDGTGPVEFEAPLPEDMAAFLEWLRANRPEQS
ncbi:RluA family pseudouridine synthase [Engelhardtia mirabilis]|uniref:RluA family pseudouridine synthase n=1 Tax=Engelhardtia mirabilis TaxID=2528011 RepID=UPI003AF3337B